MRDQTIHLTFTKATQLPSRGVLPVPTPPTSNPHTHSPQRLAPQQLAK
jgi:hypothetical protein